LTFTEDPPELTLHINIRNQLVEKKTIHPILQEYSSQSTGVEGKRPWYETEQNDFFMTVLVLLEDGKRA